MGVAYTVLCECLVCIGIACVIHALFHLEALSLSIAYYSLRVCHFCHTPAFAAKCRGYVVKGMLSRV